MHKVLVGLCSTALLLGGFAGAALAQGNPGKGNACPGSSHNPTGTPPNCGHPPPEPPPPPPPPPPTATCAGVAAFLIFPANPTGNETGVLSAPIHNQLEPFVGDTLGDDAETLVHTANCDVVVALGL
jgi:hypothetical protein